MTYEQALCAIASLGGNLADDRLTDPTGPNDARHRGLMYCEARRLALEALAEQGWWVSLPDPLPEQGIERSPVGLGRFQEIPKEKRKMIAWTEDFLDEGEKMTLELDGRLVGHVARIGAGPSFGAYDGVGVLMAVRPDRNTAMSYLADFWTAGGKRG